MRVHMGKKGFLVNNYENITLCKGVYPLLFLVAYQQHMVVKSSCLTFKVIFYFFFNHFYIFLFRGNF